eukprot:3203556-Amphidinium_carterae.1
MVPLLEQRFQSTYHLFSARYPCLAFADNMASILRGVRDLLRRLSEFRILEARVLLEDSLPALHEATHIPIVMAVRYLGFRLWRDCMYFDWQMVHKLTDAAGQLTMFNYGSLHNLIFCMILEGMMNYPLAAGEASGELRRAWHLALTRMGITSLRLDGVHSRTKDLMGLPANVPNIDHLNIMAKLNK